jgi:hypothetical protein
MEFHIMAIKKSSGSGIPSGNTAGRPASPGPGQLYSNGEAQRLELYTTGGSWENIVQEVPGVSSITGNYSQQSDSGVISVYGTNFVSGAYATAIGTNGVQVNATSTIFNSLVQLTATFTGLSNANEPYDIKVTNPSNLFGILPDALYVNANPVWNTAAGSLGTFAEQVSMSVSATATDDSTITYSLASGSSLPSGVTLNSGTGLISGTLPDVASNTTYTFTINASDGVNPAIPRTFSFVSNAAPVWNTSSGSLGSFWNNTFISTPALSTTDTDSVTYNLAVGSSLPSGLTLNQSTGVISGSLPSVGADTTYNFIINSTDGINTVARSFSIDSIANFSIDYLLAGGGGGGGQDVGGGGGAGGLIIGSTSVSGSYSISIGSRGAGGTASGGTAPNGGTTSAFSLSAIGGGGGGNYPSGNGAGGGSGGGGSGYSSPGSSASGTSGQGFAGGARGSVSATTALVGAGGGGAGGVGGTMSLTSPVLGGPGVISSITGSAETYCEGGRAFSDGAQGMRVPSSTQFGFGGDGAGTGATALGESTNESGTRGGPGVLIIAYPNTKPAITTIPGTLSYDQPTRAGYRVYRFTAGSGTITF